MLAVEFTKRVALVTDSSANNISNRRAVSQLMNGFFSFVSLEVLKHLIRFASDHFY